MKPRDCKYGLPEMVVELDSLAQSRELPAPAAEEEEVELDRLGSASLSLKFEEVQAQIKVDIKTAGPKRGYIQIKPGSRCPRRKKQLDIS